VIPKGIISLEKSDFHKLTEHEFISEFRKRFMWHDENSIRVISMSDHLDAIFKIN
jgi:hypothetical protein